MLTFRSLFVLLLIIQTIGFSFADEMKNCDLTVAPTDAKRISTHGIEFLIYPPYIDNQYTGCQIIWLEDNYKLSTTYFKSGKVSWIKGKEPKDNLPFHCDYENGILVNKNSELSRCPKSVGK